MLNPIRPKAAQRTSRPERGRKSAFRPPRFLPLVEALEDRTVPSTLTVTNNTDTGVAGDGSLRGEIAASKSGDTIVFDSAALSGKTIALSKGELTLDHSLTITGLGSTKLTVDASNGISRVLDISGSRPNVSISGITITGGTADASAPHPSLGGGIYDNSGQLTLTDIVLKNNTAVGSAGTASSP